MDIDISVLETMKRKQLQALCKQHGIKANGKNVDMVAALTELAQAAAAGGDGKDNAAASTEATAKAATGDSSATTEPASAAATVAEVPVVDADVQAPAFPVVQATAVPSPTDCSSDEEVQDVASDAADEASAATAATSVDAGEDEIRALTSPHSAKKAKRHSVTAAFRRASAAMTTEQTNGETEAEAPAPAARRQSARSSIVKAAKQKKEATAAAAQRRAQVLAQRKEKASERKSEAAALKKAALAKQTSKFAPKTPRRTAKDWDRIHERQFAKMKSIDGTHTPVSRAISELRANTAKALPHVASTASSKAAAGRAAERKAVPAPAPAPAPAAKAKASGFMSPTKASAGRVRSKAEATARPLETSATAGKRKPGYKPYTGKLPAYGEPHKRSTVFVAARYQQVPKTAGHAMEERAKENRPNAPAATRMGMKHHKPAKAVTTAPRLQQRKAAVMEAARTSRDKTLAARRNLCN